MKQRLFDLLQSCIAGKAHHIHLQAIHALSITSGFQSDVFVANVLLSGYSKSGQIRHARKLFDGMPQRNLISWSTMISCYTQHCHSEEAFSLFSCLRRCFSESPNEFILASVLRACVQSSSIGRGSQVHGLTVKMGFSTDVFVGTSLINFYSRVACLEDAVFVFDDLPFRNSVTYTAIITGYSLIGRSDKSLHLFNRMREEGVMPDRFVLSSVISACADVQFLEGGKQIHGYAYRSGAEVDISVSNALIDLYCKCSRVKTACRLFDSLVVKNLVSWTTMIAGYMQNSLDEEAMGMFFRMSRLEFRPDGFACTSVLSSCGSLMALRQGKQVHGYAIKANLENDEYVKNGLIDMYAKCNSLVDARLVFDVMSDKNTISYNAMIEGYARNDELLEVFSLFKRMRLESLRPSLLTYVSLLGASAASSAVELSKQVHSLVIKIGFSLELYIGSALVDVYSKCSRVDDARRVFDEMNERDLVVWNAMISGYAQNGLGEEAVKLFHLLCLSGLKPTDFTFVALVTASSNLTSLFLGSQFHVHIIKAGVEFDPHISNALVDMYAKCGCIQEAHFLFNTMCGRDIVCWNSMISTCAQHGYAEEALQIFHQMISKKIEPNYITFVGALSACSHVGLVEEGLSYFYSMKHDFGIEPGMEHYASVVSLLGRAGRLHEAKEFIEEMPIEPTAIVWRSFLSACRMFGDVELGNYGAMMATATNLRDSGPYVLLSNIYASKGMWVDAEKIRKGMDQIGVVKEPGYSWIEVMKEVHVFIARGREHIQTDKIYSVLDGLTQLIQDIGYIPETYIPVNKT
ncbi:pentatricopeptide repeat-containing protein At4g39530 [Dioscorea cayenensis subsp. rotundata]|uniref:Pentatricopeptide repeat-containing protein At4g39530 n=1 Tax=Dioscorea cayennensis subsp. rotundata TaxID=55577 RepID=A0AB40B9F8_DIOCR|nr:pentatricopeptide repeat-containing protein At4g39530 [Dioscorea cayenensis subsp. rotundata]XP_039123930.1 pentatricopeptide repeat-containing protein At4g39530 [Dioscorea cayenensis subsp. rotundata]